ncbi:MAG: Ig-like domain-containing protein [Candidatus Cloacimonetes bacterium]|nr:Ig-like domain-containing protein [Candidatus Cloacimonadota bacterium]MDY0173468.1 Ig-like domain-containing protein [Candidatus Cloacimonadaceae bacterium]
MKLFKYIGWFLLIIGLSACGSKRGPTGGEADLDKPTVVSSSPLEMGDISGKIIEIDFSKPMDKASITNSIYIYPPVSQRRISLTRATLKIEIEDDLLPDTNYFVTLSTRLKDFRGNILDKAHTLAFRSGKAQNALLSGLIEYEDPLDKGTAISLSLFSADSLLVMMDEVTGDSFELPNLNPASYTLRAYIDKNLNGRYDLVQEPFFEESVSVSGRSNLNIAMTYVDTTLAQIRSVRQVSPHELEITLNKAIAKFSTLEILSENSTERTEILHQYLDKDKLYVLTSKLDSTRVTIKMRNLEDFKGNFSVESSVQFLAQSSSDTTPPQLLSTIPRSGATVNDLRPKLELTFSEIMTGKNLKISLVASDTKKEVPVEILNIQGRKVIVQPSQELTNYRSYSLTILKESTDYSGNELQEDRELIFLPIKRQ